VPRGASVDGFRLAYDRAGDGPAVVALHGWPGSRRDYREVAALLDGTVDLVVPDLRGFGSRIAQAIAAQRPEAIRALVLSPPLPGVGDRVLTADAQREFWYQPFHRLALSEELIDGRRDAVAAYLRHFWEHWSAAEWSPEPAELEALFDAYARPGAFVASIAWYRAGAGTVAVAQAERAPAPQDRLDVPTTVLWPTEDPLFPVAWADRLGEFFARVELRVLDAIGHFVALEAPGEVVAAIRSATGTSA
jgi:pimeloyl-ACP methyl ester carboxylesterase